MSDMFIKGATSSSTGSIFKGIRINTLLDMLSVHPAKPIVDAFTAEIKPLLALKEQKMQENQELAKLRDWLLPMLMNGQATVVLAESAPKLQVLQTEKTARDPRFDRWLQTQGVAARGTVDEQTLHDIFDAMDDDDKQ